MTQHVIKETELEMPHFDPGLPGLYIETLVMNQTNRPIALVDRFGAECTIPQSSTYITENPSVTIYFRRSTELRHYARDTRSERPIKTFKYVITDRHLNDAPVFFQPLDVLICAERFIGHHNHPCISASYENALQHATSEIVASDGAATLRIFANDPTGSHDQLYWHYCGETMEIPITNYTNKEATISFMGSQNGHELFTRTFPLSEVFKADGFIELGNGSVIHVAATPEAIHLGLRKLGHRNTRSDKDLQELLAAHQKEYDRKLEAVKQEHALTVQELSYQIDSYKLEIVRKDDELAHQKSVNAQWTALHDAQKAYDTVRISAHKVKQEEARTAKSELTTIEAALKFTETVIKVVGAIAIVAIPIFLTYKKQS